MRHENTILRVENKDVRRENKVVRRENMHFAKSPYLCSRKNSECPMETTFILAVALSTVVLLLLIGLVVGLIYYRWRTTELMSGISEFIHRNLTLETKVHELEQQLSQLTSDAGLPNTVQNDNC